MMTPSPDAYTRKVEQQIRDALQLGLVNATKEIRDKIRRDIPAERKLTRQAVKYRITSEGTAEVGLRFSKRYQATGTRTERIFRNIWQRLRPEAFEIVTKNTRSAFRRI